MMNGEKPLKIRQICFLYIALLPVVKFFMMPSVLASVAAEDMWLSALLSATVDCAAAITLFFLLKDMEYGFFTLVKMRFGKVFYKIVLCLYLAFFIMKIFLPLNEQKDYVELTLYMTSPTLLTFMPVFLVIVYLSTQKLRVIGRIADGVFIVAVIGYILMFALSASSVDLNELLPVGARGSGNILSGAYRSQNWFGDAAYFLFFSGEYLKDKKSAPKFIFSVILSGVIVVAFCVMFYGAFGSIAFRQRFALTEISKYATVMNNIERFDFPAIFALLFTAIFSLSLPFFFASAIISELFNLKKIYASLIVAAPFTLMLLFFEQYYAGIENFILTAANGYFLFLGTVFPIAISVILRFCKSDKSGLKENKVEI